ncbi:2-succinyl-5-enolpyruvyl-6-hydroxy-3-cyclohexene-1-carboxylic-acid synthase [Succinimonas sp.]|uniref:2-succinyl-5-enolpyruvyl-6-hydroxy-3- cyclohexene-1-carboxylic-acid synthase n=1 Tax=Succinimonas sp. TaxID=1936151 RepID=UPI003867E760
MNTRPKVAYLSWLGTNYGSTLQGTALFKSIEKLGYDCEIVGASNFHKWKKPDVSLKTQNPKKYDHDLMGYNFTVFMENVLDFADELDEIQSDGVLSPVQIEASTQYSAFVCGSDQVWKPYTFWFTAKQYLTFADSDRTIGYAPSVGWKEIPAEASSNIPQWKEWLSHVRYLSARDVPSAKLLNQATGRDVTTVIDPTLLLTPEEWLGVLPPPRYAQEISEILNSGKSYLLAYLLDTSPGRENIVAKLSQKLGLEVIWLTGRSNTGAVQRNCAETDPSGFVHLISGASFVVADGFHGCCFAINFSKPFIFIARKAGPGNDSRIEDLHGRMGISGRIVTSISDLDKIELAMNFEKTVQILNDERYKSLDYLKNSLKGAVDTPKQILSFQSEGIKSDMENQNNVNKEEVLLSQKITIDTTQIDYNAEHWKNIESSFEKIAFSTVSFHEKQGCFLKIKLTDELIPNEKYQFDGKIYIDSDSSLVCIHIGNLNTEHPEIIKRISDVHSGNWQTLSFEFSPKMQQADCLIFGASQFSGRNGRLDLTEVVITRKAGILLETKNAAEIETVKTNEVEFKNTGALIEKEQAKSKVEKKSKKGSKKNVLISDKELLSQKPRRDGYKFVSASDNGLTPDVDNCRILALLLREYGVKHVVVSSGTRHMHLTAFFEFNDDFIVHNVVDERSAGFYAIGISSKLKQPVACCCTSGTAASNYLSAVTESYYQHIPLICLTTDRYSYLLNQREDQMIPQANLYGTMAKKFVQLPIQANAREVVCRRVVSEALVAAISGIPGPVHINVPISNIKRYEREAYSLSSTSISPVHYADYWQEDRWFDALNELVNYKRILVLYGQNTPISDTERDQIDKFCKNFNAAIVVDNLANLKGSCVVNAYHLINVVDFKNTANVVKDLKPELVITICGNNVLSIKKLLNNYKNFKHWEINEEGEFRDPYLKLNRVIRCPPLTFFRHMNDLRDQQYGISNNDNARYSDYLNNWKKYCNIEEVAPESYGQRYAIYKAMKNLPKGSSIHISNSLTVRLSSDYSLAEGVRVFCNRGVNGIDGTASSFMGQAAVSDEINLLMIGDLSFFYDMNSLWEKEPKGNIRIMLLNNGKAAMLAKHHLGAITARHSACAEAWVKSLGYRYLSSHTLEEFDAAMTEFYKDSDVGIFLEVFC